MSKRIAVVALFLVAIGASSANAQPIPGIYSCPPWCTHRFSFVPSKPDPNFLCGTYYDCSANEIQPFTIVLRLPNPPLPGWSNQPFSIEPIVITDGTQSWTLTHGCGSFLYFYNDQADPCAHLFSPGWAVVLGNCLSPFSPCAGFVVAGSGPNGPGPSSGTFYFGTITWEPSSEPSLSAPTNLRATQVPASNGTQIQLSWDYGSDPIDGFRIERKTPSGSWLQLSTQPSPTPPYILTDTGLDPYATYSYRIRAFKGSTDSPDSNQATCAQVRVFSLSQGVIDATFTPDLNAGAPSGSQSPLDAVAGLLGYDHFNWINWVDYLPHPWTALNGKQYQVPPDPDFVDPPMGDNGTIGGWAYVDSRTLLPKPFPADDLPFYWNEKPGPWQQHAGYDPNYDLCGPNSTCVARNLTTLAFEDQPGDNRLIPGQEFIQFITELVGVRGDGTSEPLHNFTWSTDFRPCPPSPSGGCLPPTGDVIFRALNLEHLLGSGDIFNVQLDVRTEDLPLGLRMSLIQLGARDVSAAPKIDRDAPLTASFRSGQQGANGWYTGPVTVTLIATDIDGPADLAATSYSVDGAPPTAYHSPFIVSGDGIHSIQFSSVDQAGNVEAPGPPQTIMIDATPPVISCNASPGVLWPPNHKLVSVDVSVSVSDSLSGPAGFNLISLASSEPDTAGDVQGFVIGTSSTNGLLRAERLGSGNGRVYTLVYEGADLAGNTARCSVAVTVPHDQGK